jgi:hypothetical protein
MQINYAIKYKSSLDVEELPNTELFVSKKHNI